MVSEYVRLMVLGDEWSAVSLLRYEDAVKAEDGGIYADEEAGDK